MHKWLMVLVLPEHLRTQLATFQITIFMSQLCYSRMCVVYIKPTSGAGGLSLRLTTMHGLCARPNCPRPPTLRGTRKKPSSPQWLPVTVEIRVLATRHRTPAVFDEPVVLPIVSPKPHNRHRVINGLDTVARVEHAALVQPPLRNVIPAAHTRHQRLCRQVCNDIAQHRQRTVCVTTWAMRVSLLGSRVRISSSVTYTLHADVSQPTSCDRLPGCSLFVAGVVACDVWVLGVTRDAVLDDVLHAGWVAATITPSIIAATVAVDERLLRQRDHLCVLMQTPQPRQSHTSPVYCALTISVIAMVANAPVCVCGVACTSTAYVQQQPHFELFTCWSLTGPTTWCWRQSHDSGIGKCS